MSKWTVWNFPYSTRYYLTHPWKWARELFQNIGAAIRRSTNGWTYSDVWNWDEWFLSTAPTMFRYLANHGSAYPGIEPFETPEKWRDWLYKIADLLESGSTEYKEAHNEFSMKDTKQYFARMNELDVQGANNVKQALNEIGEHFYHLWD